MARTRQKAKQRKAKRLAQQQKAEQRQQTKGGEPTDVAAATEARKPPEDVEERLEEIEQEQLGRESMTGTGIAAEVELDQARMDAELTDAQTKAREEVEEAVSAEPEPAVPAKRRGRKRAEQAPAKPSKPKADKAKREKDKRREKQRERAKRQPRERGRVAKFFVQVWAELQRVQWPTRDQVVQATGVVFGFCVIAGLYLAFWDYIWNDIVKRVF